MAISQFYLILTTLHLYVHTYVIQVYRPFSICWVCFQEEQTVFPLVIVELFSIPFIEENFIFHSHCNIFIHLLEYAHHNCCPIILMNDSSITWNKNILLIKTFGMLFTCLNWWEFSRMN